jgi:hypothetical protein
MDKRSNSSRTLLPVGSCLTLTLVLVASLAPQPAGAGNPAPLDRSPQSAALRSAAGLDFALSGLLLFDTGTCNALPLELELAAGAQAQVAECAEFAVPADPRRRVKRPRAP